jgi:hypothetical protein
MRGKKKMHTSHKSSPAKTGFFVMYLWYVAPLVRQVLGMANLSILPYANAFLIVFQAFIRYNNYIGLVQQSGWIINYSITQKGS